MRTATPISRSANLDAAFEWVNEYPHMLIDYEGKIPLGWESHKFFWQRRHGQPWRESIERFVKKYRAKRERRNR